MTQTPRTIRAQIAFLRRRDGDDCWICHLPIDFTITDLNDPLSRSRDHVVFASAGGRSTVDNMRLAHRMCNSNRHPDAPEQPTARRAVYRRQAQALMRDRIWDNGR